MLFLLMNSTERMATEKPDNRYKRNPLVAMATFEINVAFQKTTKSGKADAITTPPQTQK